MKFRKHKRTVNKELCKSYKEYPCVVCLNPKHHQGLEQTCGHHIKTKASGGPDEEWNLMPLCSVHHYEIHQMGTYRFCERYPETAMKFLQEMGWVFISKKCRHPKLRDLGYLSLEADQP